jgi:uncharacterized protein (TIGR01244 family)
MDTTLSVRQLTAEVGVAGQMQPAEMAQAAAMGYRSVVNNRPDFEAGPDQPTSQAMAAAAQAAGLEYRYLPVSPSFQSPQEIAAMAQLLRELPAPMLLFCRSGARSTRLLAAALSG